MENASKALLIAAAVLVVIILVAVGMKIFSSTTGTQKVAIDTGKSISDKAGDATDMAISAINGEKYSPKVSIASITKDNYGDYIDLGKDVIGTSATTDDWRILYNDGTNVYAILADYLPVNEPEVKKIVTAAGLEKVNTYGIYSSSSDKLIEGLNKDTAWNTLIPSTLTSGGAAVRGAVTAEILAASYNKKYEESGAKIDYIHSGYFYTDNNASKGVDKLYMPHPGKNSDINYFKCVGYYLNTKDSYDIMYYMSNTGFISRGKVYESQFGDIGIRPVTILQSSKIKVEKTTSNGTTIWKVVQ